MSMNPLQHFIIPQYDNPYTIQNISAMVADMTDSAIVAAIIQSAKESGTTDLYLIDKQFIADALREKLEREDPKPLTIEELQQMHGQPVWIEDEKAWGIINAYDFGTWKEKPFVTFFYKSVRCDWDIERRGLKCYRHKPKGE